MLCEIRGERKERNEGERYRKDERGKKIERSSLNPTISTAFQPDQCATIGSNKMTSQDLMLTAGVSQLLLLLPTPSAPSRRKRFPKVFT